MNKTHLLLLAVTLAALPLVAAHADGGIAGTPKLYCENNAGDQLVHDYATGANDDIRFQEGGSRRPQVVVGGDGSVAISAPARALGPQDGSWEDCAYFDEHEVTDLHYEFAWGGAILVAEASRCHDLWIDHPAFPIVSVWDSVITANGGSVRFVVHMDIMNNVPSADPNEPNCGDGLLDANWPACTDSCYVGWPPGLDGTYVVIVDGVAGHVWTNSP